MRLPACSGASRVLALAFCFGLLVAPPALGQTCHVPPAAQAPAEVILEAAWGPGPGQFGKVDEASRPGPMDFAVANDTLYVLDPVNGRVQVLELDGTSRQQIPLGTRTADFLCVDDSGNVTVLDAFVRREFQTFSASGHLLRSARLPASIGLPSAIFVDGERVWIEERHDRVYELQLAPDNGASPSDIIGTLPGRPLARHRGTVHARKRGTHDVVLRTATAEAPAD
jgi:hypothetical protein